MTYSWHNYATYRNGKCTNVRYDSINAQVSSVYSDPIICISVVVQTKSVACLSSHLTFPWSFITIIIHSSETRMNESKTERTRTSRALSNTIIIFFSSVLDRRHLRYNSHSWAQRACNQRAKWCNILLSARRLSVIDLCQKRVTHVTFFVCVYDS